MSETTNDPARTDDEGTPTFVGGSFGEPQAAVAAVHRIAGTPEPLDQVDQVEPVEEGAPLLAAERWVAGEQDRDAPV